MVSYRGVGAGVAEVVNEGDRVRLENGADDGVRSSVRRIKAPRARTQADCENAAMAILEDAGAPAWIGSYETWSDFLPGGAGDIFPGDGVRVNAPSREAIFEATVRNVNIAWMDPENDRGVYTIAFANELAQPLAIEMEGWSDGTPARFAGEARDHAGWVLLPDESHQCADCAGVANNRGGGRGHGTAERVWN